MSIVALKRNSARRVCPISGKKGGFSLNGGYRNQGWVGQSSLGRAAQSPCTNDPNIIKKSSINTPAMIQSRFIHPVACSNNTSNSNNNRKCPKPIFWVKNLSHLNHTESEYISNKSRKAAGCYTKRVDASANSCKNTCEAASYFIGGKKFVRTPYTKNITQFPLSQSEYLNSIFFKINNLPTPPCKQHFPPRLNQGAGCAEIALTPEEAIQKKLLPTDWENCKPCNTSQN